MENWVESSRQGRAVWDRAGTDLDWQSPAPSLNPEKPMMDIKSSKRKKNFRYRVSDLGRLCFLQMEIEHAIFQGGFCPLLHDRAGKRDLVVQGKGSLFLYDVPVILFHPHSLPVTGYFQGLWVDKVNGNFCTLNSRDYIERNNHFIIILE